MSLNPNESTSSNSWNYSRPKDDGYSLTLKGTVKAIQEVQAMKFDGDGKPSIPDFWENNGQPKFNIRIVLCGPSGGYRSLIVTPAGKAAKEGKKRSLHLDLFALTGNTNMMNLLEKTIEISTVAPPEGFGYGKGNPRPWEVKLITDEGPFQLTEPLDPQFLVPKLLANQAVSGGVVNNSMGASSAMPVSADTSAPEPTPAEDDAPPF